MPVHDWTSVVAGNFHDFHQKWIVAICDALNEGVLPTDYYAMAEQRAKGPIPDVLTLELGGNAGDDDFDDEVVGEAVLSRGGGGDWPGTLLLDEAPPRVRFTGQLDDASIYAWRADTVAVRHANGDRVVAYIEIVSPGNKNHPKAINAFGEKLGESLRRGCQFLMIDVLPPGNSMLRECTRQSGR